MNADRRLNILQTLTEKELKSVYRKTRKLAKEKGKNVYISTSDWRENSAYVEDGGIYVLLIGSLLGEVSEWSDLGLLDTVLEPYAKVYDENLCRHEQEVKEDKPRLRILDLYGHCSEIVNELIVKIETAVPKKNLTAFEKCAEEIDSGNPEWLEYPSDLVRLARAGGVLNILDAELAKIVAEVEKGKLQQKEKIGHVVGILKRKLTDREIGDILNAVDCIPDVNKILFSYLSKRKQKTDSPRSRRTNSEGKQL